MNLLVALAVSTNLLSASAPQWTTDYATALHQARRANRPLVVVIHNPHDRQQSIDQSIFWRGGISGNEVLSRFQLCRIDVTTERGKQVADAFRAQQFPYTAITDEECRIIVHRQAGNQTARAWMAMLAARIPRRAPVRLAPAYNLFWPGACFT